MHDPQMNRNIVSEDIPESFLEQLDANEGLVFGLSILSELIGIEVNEHPLFPDPEKPDRVITLADTVQGFGYPIKL